MDEFLEKLAEDQRRMRKFLRTQGPRFKKIGDALAIARERGTRIFVVGEPPLDPVARLIAHEYLAQLPAVALDIDDKLAPQELNESGELDPIGSGTGSGVGPPLIARHLSRHFRNGDVLIVFAHSGVNAAVKALLGFSKLKGVFAILVGGLDARQQLRRAADTAISLPTKGVKTVAEASFVIARIMARVARARVKEKTGQEDERLIRIECGSCHEPVFVEERFKGKKGQCPLCRSPLKIPEGGEGVRAVPAVAEATAPKSDIEPIRAVKPPSKRSKRPLKQSVLNVPAITDEDEVAPTRREERPVSEKHLIEAAGEATSGSEAEPPPVGLSSSDVDETVVAPEDVAFDEFANATESADPFALPDAFVADLVMPQGRAATGAVPPSDANPVTGSGEHMPVATTSSSERAPKRLVSSRFSIQDCKLRFGRGGYPEEDDTPEHPLEQLTPRGAIFTLDSQDETASTIDKGDELWVKIVVPAFLEPVLVRGTVTRIGGNSDGGRSGTRVEIEWKDVDAACARKLARAAETLGAASGTG